MEFKGFGPTFNKVVDIINENISQIAVAGMQILDAQTFHQSRILVLDFIKQKNCSYAIVNMKGEDSGLTYKFSFSLLYKKDDKMYKVDDFYIVDLNGDDIPAYIVEGIKKTGKAEIKFSAEDIQYYNSERDAKVEDETSFMELLQACKQKGAVSVSFADKVFYTKIDCFDAAGSIFGSFYEGVIRDVPADVASQLYPCGTVAYKL